MAPLREPWPSGVAVYMRNRACYCADVAVRLSVCVGKGSSVSIGVTEMKITLLCVSLGDTHGWRDRLKSLKWEWPHHSGVGTVAPLPPPRAMAVLAGASHVGARVGGRGETKRATGLTTTKFCHSQRSAPVALPGLPSLPLCWWSRASAMGSGLGTTTVGTAVRGWGANCRRGCWAGGGLAIPSTGCIIKKSLRQAGGRAEQSLSV